jgi:TFIIF-interacting CTD phosphatase-like protein
MLLILDLDETLFHAREEPLQRPADFGVFKYHAYRRPHLESFLKQVFEWFQIAVWTSAGADYAAVAIEHIFRRNAKLEFVKSASDCTTSFNPETQEHYPIKDLQKIKKQFPLEQVLVLDDSPEKLERQFGNLVPITPFLGDPEDTELLQVLKFLDSLRHVENVRRVEKRNWRKTTLTLLQSGHLTK